jgi:hypothetical protein
MPLMIISSVCRALVMIFLLLLLFHRGHVFVDKQTETDIPLEPLLAVSGTDTDHERVSTGTKFALEEWLKHTHVSTPS